MADTAPRDIKMTIELFTAIAETAKAVIDNPLRTGEQRSTADYVLDELQVAVDEAAPHAKYHVCADSWPRMYRAQLGLASGDENAYERVVSELGDCHTCWAALLRLVISRLTSDRMLIAGGSDELASVLVSELESLVMP